MALKEILARFGFQVDDGALRKGEKSVAGFTSVIKGAVSIYTGAQVIGAIRGMFQEMTALEGQINDQAEALGISSQAIQEWGYAATQSGASMEDVSTAIRKVQQDAGSGGAKLRKLGVDLTDASGGARDSVDVFRDAGLAIAALPTAAERTAASLEVFGKSGTKLTATFAGGADGLEVMRKRFEELGGGVSAEALDVLSQAGDRAADLDMAFRGVKSRLAIALFPALTELVTRGAKVVGAFAKMAEGSKIFQSVAIVAAAAVGRAGVKMLIPYLPFIAAIAAAVLLLDDLLVTAAGGDSAISRLVDSMLGVGATKDMVTQAKKDWASLMAELDKAPSIGAKIETAFGIVGASIVKFFAEDIGEAVDLFVSRNPEIADAALEWTNSMLAPFDAIAEAPGKVKAWGASVLASMRAAGAEWLSWASAIGRDVVDGIVSGMSGGLVKLEDITGQVGTRLKKGLRGPRGVDAHSPSRMSGEVGDDVVAGLVTRIARALPQVESMGATLGAASIPVPPAQSTDVRQTNSITIQQYGVRDPRSATRSGLLDALTEDRRALLGAIG